MLVWVYIGSIFNVGSTDILFCEPKQTFVRIRSAHWKVYVAKNKTIWLFKNILISWRSGPKTCTIDNFDRFSLGSGNSLIRSCVFHGVEAEILWEHWRMVKKWQKIPRDNGRCAIRENYEETKREWNQSSSWRGISWKMRIRSRYSSTWSSNH